MLVARVHVYSPAVVTRLVVLFVPFPQATAATMPLNAKAQFNYGNELMRQAERIQHGGVVKEAPPSRTIAPPADAPLSDRVRRMMEDGLKYYRIADKIDTNQYAFDIGLALYKLQRVEEARCVLAARPCACGAVADSRRLVAARRGLAVLPSVVVALHGSFVRVMFRCQRRGSPLTSW